MHVTATVRDFIAKVCVRFTGSWTRSGACCLASSPPLHLVILTAKQWCDDRLGPAKSYTVPPYKRILCISLAAERVRKKLVSNGRIKHNLTSESGF
jgi:hypothetical protein